jgi:hypothetical protein
LPGDFKWTLKGFWRNLKWMLAIMIAPEYILGKACADLVAAVLARREMRQFARYDGVEWGLAHCFFANMGGFVLAAEGQARPTRPSNTGKGEVLARSSALVQTGSPEVTGVEISLSHVALKEEERGDTIHEQSTEKFDDKTSESMKKQQEGVAPRGNGKPY